MVIILAIFISIFAHALNNAWPLLNLPLGGLTIIHFATVLLWLAIGLLAIVGFIFVIVWWINNGVLFKPNKWSKTWFFFGIIRWMLLLGLFYLFFIWDVDIKTGNSIVGDYPWLGSIFFLAFSMGIYDRLTILRAWWELSRASPELIKKLESDFEEYEINFDPVAHKLGLLRRNQWTGEKIF